MLLGLNVVELECCCVRMLLCSNVVVSEWRCVGMAFCRNGVMLCVVFVNGEMSGEEKADDPYIGSNGGLLF